jgi:hypothetical protein
MTLQYNQASVLVTAPRTEADYIPARILSDSNPSNNINKFSTADLDEGTNTITFNFVGVTDAGISGQYFAGVDLAIPDNVPIYTTTTSGNVNDPIYTPAVPGGGAPRGATIEVATGHTLTLNTASGSVNLYETRINAGATVTIPNGSIGHRLGTLTGTGNLRLESNGTSVSLPAAVYDDFFSCSGGGVIFAGTGSYEILGGVVTVRNLTLEGAGTKSLPNNNLTICNDLTITAGGLTNSNNRTITILNDMLLNAGTYTNNSGVLAITRDFVQTNGTFNGGAGGAKTIGRNLVVNGGTFSPGSGTTNTISIVGNMQVADAATISTGTAGTTGQRFRFNGTAGQLVTGNFSGTRAFNRLEIDNTAGLTLAGNVTVNSELLLTRGNIAPGSNTLLLTASAIATPAEGKANSFVNGKLYKALGAGGAPTSANTFTFPIGDGSLWRSGSISVASGTAATWDMQYFGLNADASEATVTNMTPVAPVVRLASSEYWKISDGSVTPTGRTAIIGLSWGIESDVNASAVERQDLRVVQWVGAPTNQWQNRGGTSFSGGNTQSRGTFTASSTISFSEQIVTLGSVDASNPLPVDLISFVGEHQNGFNKIDWKTASELNNDYFELERSATGETFSTITRISGRGTVNELSSYNFLDEEPMVGNNYYRLKQVDFDGKFEYSHIILVKNEGTGGVFNISVFPNPLSKGTLLNIRSIKDNELDAKVSVIDLTGRVLTSYTVGADNFVEKTVDTSSWSGAGIYIVEMTQGEKRIFRRVVVD